MNRYIILTDTIIDREKVVMVFRDADPNIIHVRFEHTKEEAFTGDDARILWDAFDPSRDWREDSETLPDR
jgi:hypothetical protein